MSGSQVQLREFDAHEQPSGYAAQQHSGLGQDSHRDSWHHTLCGCCASCELCIVGTCCPCILYGRTLHRIKDPSMETYSSVNGNCLFMMGIIYLTGFGWMLTMHKRAELRKRYGIKGSDARDCCASYWCLSSVLVQNEREVIARQAKDPIIQGYHSEPGMQMPPARHYATS